MDADRRNAVGRREILRGYLVVMERLPELVELCDRVEGDDSDLQTAVEATFGLSPEAATAIISLQVRRFTPAQRQRIRDELAAVEQWLEQPGDARGDATTS